MSPKKKLRLVGYVRVSKTGGREGMTFISPEQQRETIANYARLGGHEVVHWATPDIDVSGAKMKRVGLEEAFALVESGKADGVAVAKLDRFARSIAGAAEALKRLEAAGGTLLAADLGMDTSTPPGKLMRNVLLSLAEFELDRIRDNWRYARTNAILERGTYISNTTPVGYLRTVVEERKDGSPVYGPLEPDSVAAPVIRNVFLRRAKGTSWGSLCVYLDEALPREGGKVWTVRTVSDLVTREVYLGVAASGDARKENAHPAIVSQAEWEAAQRSKPSRPRGTSTALLAGFVRCSGCGHAMVRSGDGHGRGYYTYKCRRRHAGSGICPAPAIIGGMKLEKIVRGALRGKLQEWGEKGIRGEVGERYDEAVRGVEEAEAELMAWTDSGLISKLGEEVFLRGYEQREAALAAARAELEETPAPEEEIEVETAEIEDDAVLRAMARYWIDTVRIEKGRPAAVEIVWR